MSLFHSRRQAAKLLGIRRASVSAAVEDGRIRTVDVDGRERIPQSEIDRIMVDGLPKAGERKPRRKPATKDEADSIRNIPV